MGDETALHEIVRKVYDIEADDALIRRAAARSVTDRSRKFDALRKDYRPRREFSNSSLQLKNARESLSRKARALGFEWQD
jgi:erythronate-4-phosphate dehydrogenase